LAFLGLPLAAADALHLEILLDDGWTTRSALELVDGGIMSAAEVEQILAQLRRWVPERHH